MDDEEIIIYCSLHVDDNDVNQYYFTIIENEYDYCVRNFK